MRFHNLIPKIFYDRLEDGLAFFVDALGFAVLYQDADMAVVARDGAKAYLVENAEWAAKDRPELGIEVDDIEAVHAELAARAWSTANVARSRSTPARACSTRCVSISASPRPRRAATTASAAPAPSCSTVAGRRPA